MSVLSNSTKEKLNSTTILDTLFIGFAFTNQIHRISVQNVDLVWGYIDYREYRLASLRHWGIYSDATYYERRIRGT